MRLGLSRCIPSGALQQLARQMHKVRLLWLISLAQQIYLSLASHVSQRQVRATGRCQFQLLATSHETVGQSTGRRDARLGGRQGDVQRRHEEALVVVQLQLEGCLAVDETSTTAAVAAAPIGVACTTNGTTHSTESTTVPRTSAVAASFVQELGDGLLLASSSTTGGSHQEHQLPFHTLSNTVARQEQPSVVSR